ncbi:MAG: hypothetical protein OEX98_00035 [Nitrosopumilus sp.]|nr:hypothetical protein [Nitrosopumilus sp.]
MNQIIFFVFVIILFFGSQDVLGFEDIEIRNNQDDKEEKDLKHPHSIDYDIYNPRQVVFNNDLLYILESGKSFPKIAVFDEQGNLVRTIGEGYLNNADIFTFHNDMLYVENNQNILVFDEQGNLVRTIGEGYNLSSYFIFHNDLLYVIELWNDHILVFNHDGDFVRTIGEGQIDSFPYFVKIHNDLLYVAEQYKSTITVLDEQGNFVRTIGEGHLSNPSYSFIFHNDLLYVENNQNIWVFDEQGNLVRTIGEGLISTVGSMMFHNDHLYIIETIKEDGWLSMDSDSIITVFDEQGNFVRTIGEGHLGVYSSFVFNNDMLYVAEQYKSTITVLDEQGNFVRTIGEGHLDDVTIFTFHKDLLYVAGHQYSIDSKISVFDVEGKFVKNIWEAIRTSPFHFTFHNDDLYVMESMRDGNGKISVINENGLLVNEIGNGRISDADHMVFHDNLLYVSGRDNNDKYNISVFNPDGSFVRTIGEGHVGVDSHLIIYDEMVYLASIGKHKVSVFDTEGNFVRTIGEGQIGSFPYFVKIHNDLLYVMESIPKNGSLSMDSDSRISVFDTEGNFVRTIGEGLLEGSVVHLSFYENLLYVAGVNNDRVFVFDINGNPLGTILNEQVKYPAFLIFEDDLLYVSEVWNDHISVFDFPSLIINPILPVEKIKQSNEITKQKNSQSLEEEESNQNPSEFTAIVNPIPDDSSKPVSFNNPWTTLKIEPDILNNLELVEKTITETSVWIIPLITLPVIWKYYKYKKQQDILLRSR